MLRTTESGITCSNSYCYKKLITFPYNELDIQIYTVYSAIDFLINLLIRIL